MGNSCSCMRRSGEASASTPSNTESSVEEQIERSKVHWSTLAEHSSSGLIAEDESDCEAEAEVSNVREFMELQRHPTWGGFFQTMGYDLGNLWKSLGELVVGEKFAEGGQAELFHAKVTWWNPKDNELDERERCHHVVKVFKKGTFLRHLKSQLPHGLLQWYVEDMENMESPTPKVIPRYISRVYRGILLKNGQFAFLMEKDDFDLRSLIERCFQLRVDKGRGPFSNEDGESMMYDIALGVEFLHNRNIIHRDLKASNVLVQDYYRVSKWPKWLCYVADYECSVGVVGTGFFRAPEILQALNEQIISEKPEVFSRAADIYAYGMTCYEVLTGKLPFENHPLHDKTSSLINQVINHDLRPKVPKYVEGWARKLLKRCWQRDPRARPSMGEILDILSTNSYYVRLREESLKEKFGENHRNYLKHQKLI
ncbi:hypothetical protein KC19_2G147200 [Ceratodon purpureus]|uniref:Protein kinase domain-containing protein n=1 Tax=Ceratodon purpureus TaxID=3225 RepID=A0A8T0IXT4_CERPU|nr:hypothetical protein KC19_2G147200 [Ceratodon purpureus]